LILIIDNYDSFTYNLYQQVESLGCSTRIVLNDHINLAGIKALQPDKIILSPGWGTPANAGICNEVVRQLAGELPILGICLGHQCIGSVFGAEVVPAKKLLYGTTVSVQHNPSPLFNGIASSFPAARYNSLTLAGVPPGFHQTARDIHGDIMAIEHDLYPLYGVQFHPESFMTRSGDRLMHNFLYEI